MRGTKLLLAEQLLIVIMELTNSDESSDMQGIWPRDGAIWLHDKQAHENNWTCCVVEEGSQFSSIPFLAEVEFSRMQGRQSVYCQTILNSKSHVNEN